MKKHSVILCALLLCIMCCACTKDSSSSRIVTAETQFVQQDVESAVFAEPTVPTLSETTELDLSLDVEPGAYQFRFETADGSEYMDYYLFVPNAPLKDMPLIVFLHGAVEIGKVELLHDYGIASVTNDLYGNDFPFLLLLPCTHYPSWTMGPVPETLKSLIESISADYEVDQERIIITGHSMGAMGTWKMISLYSDFFSAAVPVSCGIEENIDYERCAGVPIMAFAGTVGSDEQNYYKAMDNLVTRINEAGGNACMNVMVGADHDDAVTGPYTLDLFNWMISQ